MDRLGIGIIGLGVFGERHVRIYASMPNVRLVAVCSRNPQRAGEIASRYGFDRWYTDHAELLADADVDAVSVTTEPERHFEPANAALRAGKHVLLEKPIALDMRDADTLVDLAGRSQGQLMIGHTMRFDVRYSTLKEEIAAGNLGPIVSVYARRNGALSMFRRKKNYHPVLDALIHDIDLAGWLTEDEVETVYSLQSCNIDPHRPDTCWAMLRFKGGAIGVLESAMLFPEGSLVGFDASLEVIGQRGTGHVRIPEQSLSLWLESRSSAPDVGTWPLLRGRPTGALWEELGYFVHCVQHQEPIAHGTPQQARQALRIALAINRSADEGAVVAVS